MCRQSKWSQQYESGLTNQPHILAHRSTWWTAKLSPNRVLRVYDTFQRNLNRRVGPLRILRKKLLETNRRSASNIAREKFDDTINCVLQVLEKNGPCSRPAQSKRESSRRDMAEEEGQEQAPQSVLNRQRYEPKADRSLLAVCKKTWVVAWAR